MKKPESYRLSREECGDNQLILDLWDEEYGELKKKERFSWWEITLAVLVVWLCFILWAWISSADAGPPCNLRRVFIENFAKEYKEAPVAMGLASNGNLVEVLSSGQDGTWTMLMTTPKGWSCVVATGEAWRKLEFVLKEPEA